MKILNVVSGLVVAISLGANGYFLWRDRDPRAHPPRSSDVPVVIHVKGGLLEVSRIEASEEFRSTQDHEILGIPLGRTVARVRVPAVYRYHVELAPDWKVLLKDKTFVVISPPVKPSLPVAIDTGRLEAEVSGVWAPFAGPAVLGALQKSITASLDAKARSPAQVQLQREVARQTLQEFVAKWLVTQERWKAASAYPIRVFFADEPIQALGAMPQPFAGAL